MKIGIAALGRVSEDTGGKNYILHFVKELARQNSEHHLTLFLSEGEATSLEIRESDRLTIVTIAGTKRTPLHKVFGEQVLLPRVVRRSRVDVLYCPGNFVPLRAAIPRVVNIRATAHFYGRSFGITGIRRLIRRWLMPASARAANAIITPSEDIKRDVVRFCGVPADKITVIHHGVDTDLFSPDYRSAPESVAVLQRFGLAEGQYLLYVSALWEYKNHERLIKAHEVLSRSHPGLKLVLAGMGTGTNARHIQKLKELPARLETQDLVVFTGAQPQSVLKYLYACASVFVFPSLYESFGNPIFESWASGIPVATSDVHSFPEIVDDAGVMFDPRDRDPIVQAVDRLLTDASLRAQCVTLGFERVKKFTWESCVTRTLFLITSVSQSNRSGL